MQRIWILIVVLCALLAGCGGGAAEPDEPPSADDFLAAADGICRGQVAALAEVPVNPNQPNAAANAEKANSIRGETFNRLKTLDVPNDRRGEFQDFLQARAENLEAERKLQALLERGKTGDSLSQILLRRRELSDKADRLGEKVGLSTCANALPPEHDRAVRSAIRTLQTTNSSNCRKLYAPEYLKVRFPNGNAECTLYRRNFSPAEELEFVQIGGPFPLAYAIVDVIGGGGDGMRIRFGLRKDAEQWKVTGVFALKE